MDKESDNVSKLPQRREMVPVLVCIPKDKDKFLRDIGVIDLKHNYLDLFKLLEIMVYQERTKVRELIFRRVCIALAIGGVALLLSRLL